MMQQGARLLADRIADDVHVLDNQEKDDHPLNAVVG